MPATSRNRIVLAIGIVIFCLFNGAGCIRNSPPQPMTTDSLDLLSRAGVLIAVIEQTHPRFRVDLKNDPADTRRKIFQSLLPVLSSRPVETSESIDPDYVFYFQSGRSPVTFEIRICDDRLCYRTNGFDHIGGNASEFQSVVTPLFTDRKP